MTSGQDDDDDDDDNEKPPTAIENKFLLATDADVKFTYRSVMALHDVLLRDEAVGAACGRTHPIFSVNPVVVYQVFDYAIAHWLQKVRCAGGAWDISFVGCLLLFVLYDTALKLYTFSYGKLNRYNYRPYR